MGKGRKGEKAAKDGKSKKNNKVKGGGNGDNDGWTRNVGYNLNALGGCPCGDLKPHSYKSLQDPKRIKHLEEISAKRISALKKEAKAANKPN